MKWQWMSAGKKGSNHNSHPSGRWINFSDDFNGVGLKDCLWSQLTANNQNTLIILTKILFCDINREKKGDEEVVNEEFSDSI